MRQVLFDATGRAADLRAVERPGTVIECSFDASSGALAFRVDGGRWCAALSFPLSVRMRPFVRLAMRGSLVSICPS
jgi:hypothetical protein